ncbi:MAG: hypothetical protein ABIH76_05565 [Candidatus Bathyarchaeota archaeon]
MRRMPFGLAWKRIFGIASQHGYDLVTEKGGGKLFVEAKGQQAQNQERNVMEKRFIRARNLIMLLKLF